MTTGIHFIPKYVEPILEEEKTATVRYGWDKDKLPEKGERLHLINSGVYEIFATAYVQFVESMTIEEFVNETWEGHKEYSSSEEMIWALGHFYDNSDMTKDAEIDVIKWHGVEEYE
jgi:hypothetical protein